MTDEGPLDDPPTSPDEEAQQAAYLGAAWIRIALIAILGMVLLALLLLVLAGQI